MICEAFFQGIENGKAVFEIADGPMLGQLVRTEVLHVAADDESEETDAGTAGDRN